MSNRNEASDTDFKSTFPPIDMTLFNVIDSDERAGVGEGRRWFRCDVEEEKRQ